LNSNVAALLWRAAHRTPMAPAVVERDRTTTYGALADRAAAVAATLVAGGAERTRPVGILLERGTDAVAAFFGVLAAGRTAVVLNENLRPRQIEHALAHAGARHLLTSAELLARQTRPIDSSWHIMDMGTLPAVNGRGFEPVARLDGDVAQIIHTSGSTGLPKGVAVSHGNLQAAARTVTSYLGITDADRIASLLPLAFVYGMSQVLCAVRAGAALVVERSPLPHQIATTLASEAVTVLAAVPPLWLRLLGTEAFTADPLMSLRVMTNAGGHLPVHAVRALRKAHPDARLFLMYGLTEVLRSTYLPPEEVDRRPESIGRAIPGSEVLVLREDGTEALPGEVGELVHRGPTVTLGYWNDPERTAQTFRPHPLRPAGTPDRERVVFSGDLVYRDAEGFLFFLGRRDGVIKTMGYRVGPDEVADVLYASGEVSEAAVTGEPDDQWGARIVAHIVLAPQGSRERLHAYCARELPRHLQPARIEVRDALPRLPSGKADLRALQGERRARTTLTARDRRS
jgi:amino acid adenylation domain-containing protein